MPESPGDPSNPPPAPGSEAGSTPQNNVARAPRANPASVYNPKDVPKGAPGASGMPPGFAEFMSWMQSMGTGGGAQEEALSGRALIPKEQKKFSRRVVDTSQPESATEEHAGPVESVHEAAPASATTAAGTAPRNAPPERFNVGRKRRPKEAPPRSPVTTILLQLLLFGLIVGSFFLGRATVPRGEAPAPGNPTARAGAAGTGTPNVLPPELQGKVVEALKAENESDFKRAETLLADVQRQGGQVYGLTYELAQLAYFQEDYPRVLLLLNQAIAKGEKVGAAYNLRGTLASRTSGIAKSLDDLKMSVQADPFEARQAFFTGEALRRMGMPQAAVEYLRLANYTLHEPLLEGFYNLKLDLALLDLGREKEFMDGMTAKLALNPPPLDTLFTAAGVELHRGNLAAAAGYLDRAHALATQEEMDLRLADYYFFGFSQDKELARFFASLKASAAPAKALPSATPAPTGGLGITPEPHPDQTF